MTDDYLKDRTFKLYYFDPKPLPDFAAESQCGGKHHNGAKVAFDFRALEFHDDGLRPTVLKFKDQDFEVVATDWERKNSAILNAGGWTPIVDDEGVVIAYFGHVNPAATYNFAIVDIEGAIAQEWWDEPALQPSIPFELLGMLYGGLAGRALVKAAIRKVAAKGLIKVKGAINGALLKTILRKRIVRKPLPDINEVFDYFVGRRFNADYPLFHGWVRKRKVGEAEEIVYCVTHQITKGGGTAAQQLGAATARKQAIQRAATIAKENGRPTFIMRIEQAGPQSREAAEKLFQKAGRTNVKPNELPIKHGNPVIEYVMDTQKVLANAID
jgi:hypothetical protein